MSENKNDVTTSYQQAINGTQSYLPNRTLVLNGKPVTTKAVVTILQQQIDAVQASTAAHTAWLQAVAKERATTATTGTPLLTALRHYVIAVFGINSDEYLAFGFQPSKPRVKSPEAKVIGAVKMRATRKARNIMGSKQRLAITGTVPSAIVLPVGNAPGAAPAQPIASTPGAASAQPVASAPGATPAQPSETVTVTTSTNGAAATR
jgi:hypothetical protein